MFGIIKKPFITALTFTAFTFLILTYQNCAKPLDEIGLNSSLSTTGCSLTLGSSSVRIGSAQTIAYSFAGSGLKIRVVVMNNATGAFNENIYTQSGTLSVTYTTAAETGDYTVYGMVEDASGTSIGSCNDAYSVSAGPPTGGTNPPQVLPGITLTGNIASCTTSCTLALTSDTSTVAASGKVFKIVRNGTTSSDVICRDSNGSVTTNVPLTFAANPGVNSFVAYLVANCAASTAGAMSAATYNVTVSNVAYTYAWSAGAFGACSATACGTYGTQSRAVSCKRSDGATVADSNCSGTKPALSQSCYAGACGGGGGPGGPGGPGCKVGTAACQIQ